MAKRPPVKRAQNLKLTDEARAFFNQMNSIPAEPEKRDDVCACCGKRLDENTGVRMPEDKYRGGYHPVCLLCQIHRTEPRGPLDRG